MKRINLGSKNGMWKGGIHFDYYRRIAFENLPKRCAICGTKKNLQVHHKDQNRKNNKLFNLMILCSKCHGKVHQLINGWSKDYDACIICHRTDRKHNAHGICMICYNEIYDAQIRKKTKRRIKYVKGTKKQHISTKKRKI